MIKLKVRYVIPSHVSRDTAQTYANLTFKTSENMHKLFSIGERKITNVGSLSHTQKCPPHNLTKSLLSFAF